MAALTALLSAVKDRRSSGRGALTRDPSGPGTCSPAGIRGDPTLATREKGRIVVEAVVEGVERQIEGPRAAPLWAAPPR